MSAYMVSDAHINYLVSAAYAYRVSHPMASPEELAKAFYHANRISMIARYPDDVKTLLPLPGDYSWPVDLVYKIDPFKAYKLAQGFDYQACECDSWRDSMVKRVCDAIQHAAISSLPQYQAAPWSI